MTTVDRSKYCLRFFTLNGIETVYLENEITRRTWGFQFNLEDPEGTFKMVSPVDRPQTTDEKNLTKENITFIWNGDSLRFGVKVDKSPSGIGIEIDLGSDKPVPQPLNIARKSNVEAPAPVAAAAEEEDPLIPIDDFSAEEAPGTGDESDFRFDQ